MTDTTTDPTAADATSASAPVNPVPHDGDHDRVAMLSLHADGTPAQHKPELIGPKDAAVAAHAEQFRQQAVSAADAVSAAASAGAARGVVTGAPQDPSIQQAIDQHEAVAAKATEAAQAAVEQLTTSDGSVVTPDGSVDHSVVNASPAATAAIAEDAADESTGNHAAQD